MINQIRCLLMLMFSIFIMKFNARSQVQDDISDKLYYTIIENYLSIYTTIENNYDVDIEKFKSLFTDGEVFIDNDFFIDEGYTHPRFPNPGDYINHLLILFQHKSFPGISDLTVKLPIEKKDILFGYDGKIYHAWVNKIITYKLNGRLRPVDTWVHLKIRPHNGVFKIIEIKKEAKPTDPDNDKVPNIDFVGRKCDICPDTETGRGKYVTIDGCLNNDRDEDGVENDVDQCDDEKGPMKTRGCPDTDGDGIKNSEDKCKYRKGPNSNSGCPISSLGLSVSVGYAKPFGTPYSETKILDNQTYQWTNRANLASAGLMFGLCMEYHFSTWLGLGIGGMNISNKFDNDRLRINIETFLANNNIPYNHTTITTNAYQYNVAYFKLSFGNFRSSLHQFKIEPLIGEAFNGFFRNESITQIDYQASGEKVKVISFKTKPFLMYGCGAKYGLAFPESPFGLFAQAWFLTGTPDFPEQVVSFANHPTILSFSSQRIQMAAASVGLQLSISKGEVYYRN
jgi:hypothetical protein